MQKCKNAKAAGKREENETCSDSPEREQARPKVKERGLSAPKARPFWGPKPSDAAFRRSQNAKA